MDQASLSHAAQKVFDVFISFRGEDTRNTFVDFLYQALCQSGIMTFRDDMELLIGDNLNEELVKAIEESRILIVVLSKNYASSKWCLRELVKIMDCMDKTTHRILPVFYHVDPSDVRRQSGNFKKSFDQHEEEAKEFIGEQKEKYLEEVRNWKDSMTKIGNLAGEVVTAHSSEAVCIKEITKQILDILYHREYVQSNNLVDMLSRLYPIENLIDLESNDACFVGIVGIGGIGKTTIAQVFYNKFVPEFDYSCFLHISRSNLVSLQYQLLRRLILKTENIEIWNENDRAKALENHLSGKKVLIVLDGVDDRRQLESLAGSPSWFGPKSIVLITTRNRDILRQPNYEDKIQEYNVELLSDESALELFCKYAFRADHPDQNFMDLTWEILEKVKGHPLALIKIGSSLYGRSIDIWELQLKKNFHDILVHEDLFSEILRTSYEELDVDSQNLLLDLACFFNGERVERVTEILESFGYRPPDAKLRLFVDRCLIDISHGRIQMPFVILCTSQAIAQGKLGTRHGNQTRIWLREDVRRVFREKNGLHKIQGIVDLGEEEELALEAESFLRMTALRILEIDNVKLHGDVQFLSNQLRLLNWSGYPSKYLPSTFQSQYLSKLHLRGSNVRQLWEGRKTFANLKEIDVSDSKFLVETPDFLYVRNLRRLILRNCESLQYIHWSIDVLDRLVLLDLEGCVSLTSFSYNDIFFPELFPNRNRRRSDLQSLILSNSGLVEFPRMDYMEYLTELHLNGTLINKLHPSIRRLTRLLLLNLRNCTQLCSLPREIGRLKSLKTLILNGCEKLDQIPPALENVESLEKLDIGRTSIKHGQPEFIHTLWNLEILNCERLSSNIWCSLTALFSYSSSSIRDLNLSDCNLEDKDIPKDLHCFSELKILDLSGNHFVELSQSLGQLINLKALYLNDCTKLKQLPKLPASLRHVGLRGVKSLDMLPNLHSGGSSSSLLSKPPLKKKTDDLAEKAARKEYRFFDSARDSPAMTKVILKLEVPDKKSQKKVMSTASTLSGVYSISMNMKEKKMTVRGNVDPVSLVTKLGKICKTEIVSVSVEQDKVENKMEKQISYLWHSRLPASDENLVGMEGQVEKVCKLLDLERKDVVLFLGIFGTSGIGKTGIAKVVYYTIADEFESSCFLHISKQNDLISLQHQLLSQLLSREDFKIWDKDCGVEMIKNYVHGRKVLIVLDGVDEESQVEKLVGLAGSPDWFGPGSRVVVTAGDRQVLLHQLSYRDKMVEYNVALLDDASALRLFCNHAFESGHPDDNLKDVCEEIVRKLEGLPLALRVVGSFLKNKDFAIWEETLMRLYEVEQDFLDAILQRS